MVFSSIPFLFFFLPLFLVLYYAAGKSVKNYILLLFSLVFYAWGEPVHILLMILSSFVDYADGLILEKFSGAVHIRRLSLAVSLLINFSLLAYFKYADFAVGIAGGITGLEFAPLKVALPVGISFYTFQTASYSIDVYRGGVRAEKNYFRYLTYVSMFPQLIAGPIVRFGDVQKELACRDTGADGFFAGLRRFLLGLFRKVLIANQIGLMWDQIRMDGGASVATAWIGVLSFTLQLYYDFSAYSDMAIGLGRMLGFTFPENFVYPLSAVSITDFWHRWHISLSTWFRDYVYIPLGGNRVGIAKHLRNMFAVWFLTGLWHGASWNFVIWGLYHGVFLTLEKYVWGGCLKKLPSVVSHLYTVVIVILGFGIFYFDDMGELFTYFARLLPLDGRPVISTDVLWYTGNFMLPLSMALLFAFPVYPKARDYIGRSGRRIRTAAQCAGGILMFFLFALTVASLVRDTYNPFLYFRF